MYKGAVTSVALYDPCLTNTAHEQQLTSEIATHRIINTK